MTINQQPGTLCTHRQLRSHFDVLIQRNFRQGEEIECLLRGIAWHPVLFATDGGLAADHSALFEELRRLYSCMEDKGTVIDELSGGTVLKMLHGFLTQLDFLTEEVEEIGQDLKQVFDLVVRGNTDCFLKHEMMESIMARARQRNVLCWILRMKIQPLIHAIRCEGRNRRAGAVVPVVDEPEVEA